MNLDADSECTCDVGIFATCETCRASESAKVMSSLNERQAQSRLHRPNYKPQVHIVDLALHYQRLAKEESKK